MSFIKVKVKVTFNLASFTVISIRLVRVRGSVSGMMMSYTTHPFSDLVFKLPGYNIINHGLILYKFHGYKEHIITL